MTEQDDTAGNDVELTPEEEKRARILGETAKIPWTDLQRFFAGGLAIGVHPELDLVDVAYQMSVDNEPQIKSWMDSGHLAQISDGQAIEWLEANALMWAVVVKPWVLVQPILLKQ